MLRLFGRKPKNELKSDESLSLTRIAGQNLGRNSTRRMAFSSSQQLVSVSIPIFEGEKFYKNDDVDIKRPPVLSSFPKYTLPVPNFLKIMAVPEPIYENYEVIEQARKDSLPVREIKNPAQNDSTDPASLMSRQDEGYISGHSPARKNGICLEDPFVSLSTDNDSSCLENLTTPIRKEEFIFKTNPVFSFGAENGSDHVENLITPVREAPPPPINFASSMTSIKNLTSNQNDQCANENEKNNLQKQLKHTSLVLKKPREEDRIQKRFTIESSEAIELLGFNYINTTGFIQRRSRFTLKDYLQAQQENGIEHMIEEGSRYSGPSKDATLVQRNLNKTELPSPSYDLNRKENMLEDISLCALNVALRQNSLEHRQPVFDCDSQTGNINANHDTSYRRAIWNWMWRKVFRRK